MEHAFQILVIVLSSVLGIFLIVAIIAIVMVVKLVKELRTIVKTGNAIASKAEALTSNLAEGVAASNFVRIVTGLVKAVRKFK